MNCKSFTTLLALGSLIFMWSACEFTDTDPVTVPAYICIPSFTFETDTVEGPGYQGRATHKYTDMWVAASGNSVGATGLPLLLPVQRSGVTRISVDAGILKSGQDDQRTAYPFSATYTQDINLKPNQIDTIRPVFRYLPSAKFPLIVDFDKVSTSDGFKLNPLYTSTGDTFVAANDAGSVEPNNPYMKLQVAAASQSFQMYTEGEFELPQLGAPVYLEVDYKSNMIVQFGYYYQEPGQPSSGANSVIELFPTNGWNKIYIYLTDEVSIRKAMTRFKFYFGFFNTSGIQPEVSFDNIKIVTLE